MAFGEEILPFFTMLTVLVADPLRFAGDRICMKVTTLIVSTSAWRGA